MGTRDDPGVAGAGRRDGYPRRMAPSWDLLALDLDGTLLGPDGRISDRDAEAVARARDAGIEVVLATGRCLIEALHAVERLEHDGLLVAASGAATYHLGHGRTVDVTTVCRTVVKTATDVLIEAGHRALLLKESESTGCDYVTVGAHEMDAASRWWFETAGARLHEVDDHHEDPHPEDTMRVGAVGRSEALAPIAERLSTELGDRAYVHHWSAVTSTHATGSSTHLLEVFEPTVDKWTALVRICAEFRIDPARVAAIGDGLNDVGMIKAAGLGIAMENAEPRVHAVSDRTTGHHARGGVADAIDRIVDGAW